MRISLDWLSQYVELPADVGLLAERLTLSGSEVERVITQQVDFEGVVVAEVASLRPHPNANKLQLALLATGGGEPVEVVTGATNLAVGNRVPLAMAGARLHERRIGRQQFRGVVSDGMLCSAIELGLGEDADGIMILDSSAALGADLRTLYPPDTVLELEIKSNRPDLLCHLGLAREVSALFNVPLRMPAVSDGRPATAPELVTVEAREGCRRFVGRLLTGVRVAPSPPWMQARLRAAGVRPISNVVDITNYVMLEMGQPMHAFDYRRLEGGRLVVRRARSGERLHCLDGKTRELHPEFLVVADAERPQALAGIIGGSDSAVEWETTEVLLEAATWEPRSVRATARKAGLRTEASSRFEKGLSPALGLPAVDRAAALIAELAGGTSIKNADVYHEKLAQAPITLEADRLEQVLGIRLSVSEAGDILRRLQFQVHAGERSLEATPPEFRLDCSIPEDLVEEVGRIYGYDRIPSTLPGARSVVRDLFTRQDADELAREVLVGRTLEEAVTHSLVSRERTADIRMPEAPRELAQIANPMAENRDGLRVSLLPGLLEVLAFNARQDQGGVRLFELGSVFWGRDTGAVDEPRLLAIAVHVPTGGADAALKELREVQSALVALRDGIAFLPTEFRQSEAPGFHAGRSAEIVGDGQAIGVVGEVHPRLVSGLDLPGRVLAAEAYFERLVAGGTRTPRARTLARFPGVRRDLTVIVRGKIASHDLVQVIRQLGGYTLREISMLNEYQGPQLGAGARSLSFRLQYQADDRTLTGEEVAGAHQRIIDGIKAQFNVEVRA